MTETKYKPIPRDEAFRKALLAKPGVQKAFDALHKVADSDGVNLSNDALCPICGQGQVTSHFDTVESQYMGNKAHGGSALCYVQRLHVSICRR
jgi:hypothetical protein